MKFYFPGESLILFNLVLLTNFRLSLSTIESLNIKVSNEKCDPIICPISQKDLKSSSNQQNEIALVNIESNEDQIIKILSNTNEKLFFVESSGKNYLTPRDGCAIESAVKNSGLDRHMIFAMTSPSLNISKNNVTCHIYQKYNGHSVHFLYVNVDTIFKGTPIQNLHENGFLKHDKEINTIVQYR